MTLSDLEPRHVLEFNSNVALSICNTSWLGQIDYQSAYKIQKHILTEKTNGREDDYLLILEHRPTITIGKSGKLENLLVPREMLAKMGVSLFFTDRGGDITFHGPGQLVVYPIVDLKRRKKDIHNYIADLQEVTIRMLGDYGISARCDNRYVGVWVGNEKIGAIGVAVHRWITMHGLALNINTNMAHFSLIRSCGITDRGVTSMKDLLNHDVPLQEAVERFVYYFARVFTTNIVWQTFK